MAYLHNDKEQFKNAISNSFAHGTQYIGEMMEKAPDAKNFDELTKMVTTWRRMRKKIIKR